MVYMLSVKEGLEAFRGSGYILVHPFQNISSNRLLGPFRGHEH